MRETKTQKRLAQRELKAWEALKRTQLALKIENERAKLAHEIRAKRREIRTEVCLAEASHHGHHSPKRRATSNKEIVIVEHSPSYREVVRHKRAQHVEHEVHHVAKKKTAKRKSAPAHHTTRKSAHKRKSTHRATNKRKR